MQLKKMKKLIKSINVNLSNPQPDSWTGIAQLKKNYEMQSLINLILKNVINIENQIKRTLKNN